MNLVPLLQSFLTPGIELQERFQSSHFIKSDSGHFPQIASNIANLIQIFKL